jgi:hypothetical protein
MPHRYRRSKRHLPSPSSLTFARRPATASHHLQHRPFVGAALGYLVGALSANTTAGGSFIVSAIPGTIIAILIAFLMKEPARGASQQEKAKLEKGTVSSLLKNKAYLSSILGYAAVTFSLGGISWWMPSFLQRVEGRSESSAAYLMGVITLCGGLGGTIFGGFVAQRWSRTNSKALYLVPAFSSALAVPPAPLAGPHSSLVDPAAVFHSLGTGPVNAATHRRTPRDPRHRHGGQLFIIHALGDISPTHHRARWRPLQPQHRFGSTLITTHRVGHLQRTRYATTLPSCNSDAVTANRNVPTSRKPHQDHPFPHIVRFRGRQGHLPLPFLMM